VVRWAGNSEDKVAAAGAMSVTHCHRHGLARPIRPIGLQFGIQNCDVDTQQVLTSAMTPFENS
jgi:hypothetical protein